MTPKAGVRSVAFLMGVPMLVGEPNVLTAKEKNAGWTLLFEGKTPGGWRRLKSGQPGDGWPGRVEEGGRSFCGERRAIGWPSQRLVTSG